MTFAVLVTALFGKNKNYNFTELKIYFFLWNTLCKIVVLDSIYNV